MSLLRSNLAVASGTAMSRLTGLIRVGVFASVLGLGALTDAYNQANATPNAVYELLLGGVLSSALVPLITRLHSENDRVGQVAVRSVVLAALVVVTAVAVVASPWIFRVYGSATAPGVDAELYRDVGGALAAFFLVQIFFYGVNALASAELNARGKFMVAAWAPAAGNLAVIGSLLWVDRLQGDEVATLQRVLDDGTLRLVLGLGATAGIALMAVVLIPPMIAAGAPMGFRPAWRHPAVAQLRALSGWTLGYVIANQAAVVVVQRLLLQSGEGDKTAYFVAFAIFTLPHGLLAMSIATTFQPEMSRAVVARDRDRLIERSELAIRLVALMTIPAGFGLFVLRRPIVGIAAQYGNFSADDALLASRALAGFALGLGGFSVYLVTLRVMYAHRDARSPYLINLFENLINIVLAVALYRSYGVLGIAASFAIAYVVAALWALQVLGYKVRGFPTRRIVGSMARMAVASLAMIEVVWLVANAIGDNDGAGALARVLVGGGVGGVVYIGLLIAMGAPELRQLQSRLRPR